ncbi:site-specific integrase [Methyloceanibacter superfactus]|uniref:site-specific integrase n=1 Tax=Methyloceanibacter superfactus TaxID=1774969 RepID=UPI0008499BF9|nr:tyrosine-type recombinase/integrase [Methyloceanibacter superfactus]
MKINLRYISEDMDRHGNMRLYVRRNGRKIRIRERWGTEGFVAAYNNALAETERPKFNPTVGGAALRGSLRWLLERYFVSAEFKQLRGSTQRVRRGILDNLSVTHGTKPFARMEPRHVRQFRDEKAELPEAANGRLKALRQVFKWAVEAGHAERNPATDVPYIKTSSEGFHTWTIDEVYQYLNHHGTTSKAARALTFLLYTGAARGDLVDLGRQHRRNDRLVFKRKKTRVEVEIPIMRELRAAIEATPPDQLTFIVTEFGKPFTPAGFGNKMRYWCDQAELPHCSAHGLRKAGATLAANNGATAHQLMAIFGWTTLKEAERYTRRADRKRLANTGMHFISLGQIENEIAPPDAEVAVGGTKGSKK